MFVPRFCLLPPPAAFEQKNLRDASMEPLSSCQSFAIAAQIREREAQQVEFLFQVSATFSPLCVRVCVLHRRLDSSLLVDVDPVILTDVGPWYYTRPLVIHSVKKCTIIWWNHNLDHIFLAAGNFIRVEQLVEITSWWKCIKYVHDKRLRIPRQHFVLFIEKKERRKKLFPATYSTVKQDQKDVPASLGLIWFISRIFPSIHTHTHTYPYPFSTIFVFSFLGDFSFCRFLLGCWTAGEKGCALFNQSDRGPSSGSWNTIFRLR
jgi:hypothetical protein